MAPAPKQRKGIHMLVKLYLWFISLFERDHSTKTNEDELQEPLKLDLQFFGDDEEDDEDDEGSDDDESDEDDEELDLDELLKDPAFKKQYNKRFKKQLGKRMKKFEGIDPEEYRRLKEQAGKKKDKQGNEDDDDETETLREQLQAKEKKLLRAERREKRAMVKEYAVDNQVNPKLLARLINVDDIELDEDGEAENLDDLFEELEEEFPEYFGTTDDEDDDKEEETRKKTRRSSYVPGARKKGNKKKKVDPKEAGRQKALERHKKEDK